MQEMRSRKIPHSQEPVSEMSNDLNQCNFIGRFGKKPECRYMPNGDAVASGSIAVGRHWKDKQTGERKEATTWVPVNFYGKLAEIVSEFCDKGSRAFISGEFSVRKWQDKQTGQDRYSTEIKANTMQMLDSRNAGGQGGGGNDSASGGSFPGYEDFDQQPPQRGQQQNSYAQQTRGGGFGQQQRPAAPAPDPAFDDDLPF